MPKVNQMGDVLGLYNTTGTQVVRYRYDAWGKLLEIENNNGQTITNAENIGMRNPFRYRGYYYDTDTGFYYLNARYYDPETGRFLNADGYASTGQGFVGNNMFAYCNNNPVMYADYTGECPVVFIGPCPGPGKCKSWRGILIIPSSPAAEINASQFQTGKNSWAFYDNKRHDPDKVFHEQVLL